MNGNEASNAESLFCIKIVAHFSNPKSRMVRYGSLDRI